MSDRQYKTEWARQWRWRNGTTPRPSRPFAVDGFVRAAMLRVPETDNPSADLGAAYRLLGITGRSVSRWRHIGLDAYSADVLACRLGRHPSEILGYEWFAQADDCVLAEATSCL